MTLNSGKWTVSIEWFPLHCSEHIHFTVSKACSKFICYQANNATPQICNENTSYQPLLEYYDVAWSPGALKLIDKLVREFKSLQQELC